MDRRELALLALVALVFTTSAASLFQEIYLPIVIRSEPRPTATLTAIATVMLPTATNTPAPTATNTLTATNPPSGSCNCTGPDLDCTDFSSHAQAQSCFNYCVDLGYGDVFGLDRDNDGVACETLP